MADEGRSAVEAVRQFKKAPRDVLRTVGRCIYCFTDEAKLSEEHIVPYGLGGHWILREGSCERCANITKRFEHHLLREVLPVPRASLNLPTRRPRERPETYPLTIVRENGETELIELLGREYPAVAIFPLFAPPVRLVTRPYSHGIDVNGTQLFQVGGPPVQVIAKRYSAKIVRFTVSHKFDYFQRVLLKIAYGFAVAKLGLNGIDEAYVLASIKGERDDSGMWLGCDGNEEITASCLHGVRLQIINGEILTRVRLFARARAPEYVVVVGRTRSE